MAVSSNPDSSYRGKVVVVGDGGCGKTCLLEVYRSGEFPEKYVPTVVDNFISEVEIDGKKLYLTLWDTSGQEDYDALRPLSYNNSDLILICYSVVGRKKDKAFENVENRWLKEVGSLCPRVPIFLVGLKTDLRRGDPGEKDRHITYDEGQALATTIGAKAFNECSSREKENVKEIFEQIARYIIAHGGKSVRRRTRKRFICC
jgi:Ras homolog gene family, member A